MADYYLDFDAGSAITGTVTFTNGSDVLSGSGTMFTVELAVGNYVRTSAGTQWYKITAITDDLTATISPAFQQATVTDTADATLVNAGDGSTAAPFCHLNQYTTDTIRTAGDRLFVQNGQAHTYAGVDIIFDEDGTPDAYIEIIGSDWLATGSAAKPVFDFGGTLEQFNLSTDRFWRISSVAITGSTDEGVYAHAEGSVVNNVDFYGNVVGARLQYGGVSKFTECTFSDNSSIGLAVNHSHVEIRNSSFDGPGTTLLETRMGGTSYLYNCKFGQIDATATYDLYINYDDGKIILDNCIFDINKVYNAVVTGYVKSYNHQQVKGAYWSKFYNGVIEKEETIVRTGGATSSIKVTPNSNCTENVPLLCAEWFEHDVAAASTTRTVYIDVEGITSTFPTATQLWLEAEYYDATTGTTTSKAVSTDVLTANSTWTAFSVTFTPGQVGRVVYRIWLAYSEGAESYYIDNQLN